MRQRAEKKKVVVVGLLNERRLVKTKQGKAKKENKRAVRGIASVSQGRDDGHGRKSTLFLSQGWNGVDRSCGRVAGAGVD